jgi:hypothetical protein
MSYNGSGTFLINSAGQPVVANTVISATVFNSLTADLATGLSTAITKDGQTTVTANIPFGNNKITTLGAGTAATDAANLGQVQSTAAKLITVTGTDTITGSMSPQLTAYAAGQLLYFIANAANTGAVTINVDGLGAKAITRDGSTALAAGDINSGEVVVIVYDGTRFQMINAANSFGNTTINGTLTVTGNTGLQANVSITSALSVGGTFNVTGAATLGSTLSVTGKSDLPTVSTASINAAVAVVTTGTVTNLTSTSASIASANAAVALVTTGTVTNLTSTSASIASANLGTAVVTGLTVTGASIASVNVGAAVLSGNLTLSSGTAGGVVYLDGSKVATSGSALTFDGSTLTNTGNSTGTIFNTIVNTDAAGSSITDERIVFAMGGSLGFGVTGWANAGIIEATSTGGLYLGAYNGPINFSSGASARNINMTLTASGDLGIGTTSPAAKLQVVTSSGVAQIITNSDATNGFGLKITAGGSASARYALHVLDPTDTTSYFKISTETGAVGNVGIGTASPLDRLDVVSGSSTNRNRVRNSTSDEAFFLFQNSTTGTTTSSGLAVGIDSSENAYLYNYINSPLIFATNATERARITAAGELLVGVNTATANGGVIQVSNGITFPATQSAASNANTLDDYEEGTFTPTINGSTTPGTTTYVSQVGNYTKVGRLVSINIYLEYTALTGTGKVSIGGLPFNTTAEAIGTVMTNNLNWTGGTMLTAYFNSSSGRIFGSADDGAITEQDCVNEAAYIYISATYPAS